ncbi:unnamed protein product [Pleuronectes platessa]|uniref:Uncharacterized protein n=1 Tax=Pleuronectes platessa TaxID=8262 RepID=A0A9N7Z0W0_PLEPL|nr:unnamed protein product [Pleuronectes platessa]
MSQRRNCLSAERSRACSQSQRKALSSKSTGSTGTSSLPTQASLSVLLLPTSICLALLVLSRPGPGLVQLAGRNGPRPRPGWLHFSSIITGDSFAARAAAVGGEGGGQ